MTFPDKRRALITGASSGIGKETALAFAKAGIDVALVSRSLDKLTEVAEQARKMGVDARTYVVDLAIVGQVKDQMTRLIEDFGRVDVLVNNAGMGYTGMLRETPLTDWQQVMDLNLTSAFQCIQAVLPGMRDRQRGLIINVASNAGQQAFPGWGAYSVSKAGMIALSRCLAVEERGNGVRVATLCPGAVNTPLWDTETVEADFDRTGMLTPEAVAQSILQTVLLPEQAVVEALTLMPSAGAL
ncbi:MAG: SDR family oxidoreductase [Leptolyngbyaceae cyanobacterium MO_188.B28]|nr:SDR family oxidoreductase [Leptolyngbyaceae cyanobacterium MO_188.B28]